MLWQSFGPPVFAFLSSKHVTFYLCISTAVSSVPNFLPQRTLNVERRTFDQLYYLFFVPCMHSFWMQVFGLPFEIKLNWIFISKLCIYLSWKVKWANFHSCSFSLDRFSVQFSVSGYSDVGSNEHDFTMDLVVLSLNCNIESKWDWTSITIVPNVHLVQVTLVYICRNIEMAENGMNCVCLCACLCWLHYKNLCCSQFNGRWCCFKCSPLYEFVCFVWFFSSLLSLVFKRMRVKESRRSTTLCAWVNNAWVLFALTKYRHRYTKRLFKRKNVHFFSQPVETFSSNRHFFFSPKIVQLRVFEALSKMHKKNFKSLIQTRIRHEHFRDEWNKFGYF